jgi:hypothetical protein
MQKQNQTNTKNVERHATGARGTDLPPLFFTSLLANKTQIYYHIVPQTLILIYTISFFYCNHVLI